QVGALLMVAATPEPHFERQQARHQRARAVSENGPADVAGHPAHGARPVVGQRNLRGLPSDSRHSPARLPLPPTGSTDKTPSRIVRLTPPAASVPGPG